MNITNTHKTTSKTYTTNLFNYLSRVKADEINLIKLSIKYKYIKGGNVNYQIFGGHSPPK